MGMKDLKSVIKSASIRVVLIFVIVAVIVIICHVPQLLFTPYLNIYDAAFIGFWFYLVISDYFGI